MVSIIVISGLDTQILCIYPNFDHIGASWICLAQGFSSFSAGVGPVGVLGSSPVHKLLKIS